MQRHRRPRPLATKIMGIVGFTLVALMCAPLQGVASASTYYSGSGYDASYPQCSATAAPTLSFAIIGVEHGRPFTVNTCAGAEWKLAGANGASRSLYFNTGYALAYAKSETANCKKSSLTVNTGVTGHQISVLQTAWAIGCSEADSALAAAPGTPSVWWADIETGNSWSTNTTINQFTVTGIFAELHNIDSGAPAGVYSSPSMWSAIVGTTYTNSAINADWQAGLISCSSSSPGFTLNGTSTAPLWLAQSGSTIVGGVTYDADSAC